MTGESVGERLEYRQIMFTNSIDIAAQAEEAFCAGGGAEAARDFLPDFEHAEDLLGVVVGEGDAEIAEEGERRFFVTAQAVQEVESLALFWAAAAGGGGSSGRRIGGAALSQEGIVASDPREDFGSGKPGSALRLKILNSFVHVQQEPLHFSGPTLMEGFKEEGQLAQEVGVAQAVKAGPFEIGGKAIVDEAAVETGEDGEVFHGFSASPGMEAVPRQKSGAESVDPLKFCQDAQSGLIGVEDFGGWKQGHDFCLEALQVLIGRRLSVLDDLLADALSEDIGAELTEAVGGDELLIAQIDQQSEKADSVLHGSQDVRRERSGYESVAARAEFGFGAMLSDEELLGRQIEDLASDVGGDGPFLKRGSAPPGADVERNRDDLVRFVDGPQGGAGMTRLAAGLSPVGLTEAFGRGLLETIGRWGLAAVSGIECEAGLKVEHDGD